MRQQKDIVIIGCGPGSRSLLTFEAWEEAGRMDVIIGAGRLLALFEELPARKWIGSGVEESFLRIDAALVNPETNRIGVAVSGDPGLYSLTALLLKRYGNEHCRIVPGISSPQAAMSRLGLLWSNGKILSAHGRLPVETASELKKVSPITILCGEMEGQRWAYSLARQLRQSHRAWLCQDIGLSTERVLPLDLEHEESANPLSLVVLASSSAEKR